MEEEIANWNGLSDSLAYHVKLANGPILEPDAGRVKRSS